MWLFILYLEHIGVDNNGHFPRNKTQRFEFQIRVNEYQFCVLILLSLYLSYYLVLAKCSLTHWIYIYFFPWITYSGFGPKGKQKLFTGDNAQWFQTIHTPEHWLCSDYKDDIISWYLNSQHYICGEHYA